MGFPGRRNMRENDIDCKKENFKKKQDLMKMIMNC